MQTDDGVNATEPIVGEDVERSAGYSFLRRLEDESDWAVEFVAMLSEVERRAEHDGGVHVMAACVGDARHVASVGHVLLVSHRQRIEVGADGEPAVECAVGAVGQSRGDDVADQAGAHGEPAGVEAGEFESFVHQVGGRLFLTAQFWVSVQISSQRDEAVAVFVEPPIDRVRPDAPGCGRQLGHRGASAPVIVSAASSAARWWTTSASVPPASTTCR